MPLLHHVVGKVRIITNYIEVGMEETLRSVFILLMYSYSHTESCNSMILTVFLPQLAHLVPPPSLKKDLINSS